MKSDGCTLWWDGNWRHCCVAHDEAYYLGGTYKQRLAADVDLMRCVVESKRPYMAIVMFLGVRIFGGSWWPHRFRWGKGSPYFRKRARG